MFRPVACFVGWRYTLAKKRNHFIGISALISMLGMALGVAVLITVLSVMNGFSKEIRETVFSLVRQVTVSGYAGTVDNWRELRSAVLAHPQVAAAIPLVDMQGILVHAGLSQPTLIAGILPEEHPEVLNFADKMQIGELTSLQPGSFRIVLGEQLARQLMVTVGDTITFITPEVTTTPAGIIPRFKRFQVSGIFSVGSGFNLDDRLALIHLDDAQRLFNLDNKVSLLQVKLHDLYQAPRVSADLMHQLPGTYASDWTQTYGVYFDAIQLEKRMMFLMLLLIVAVAAFNLISTLTMMVHDKQADIAILRTLGATPRTIMAVFIVQGALVGLIGILLGTIGGLLLAANVTEVVQSLERLFNIQFLSASIYYIDYLPTDIQLFDILRIIGITFVLSLLATIYPAWRAARIQPAEALRYE